MCKSLMILHILELIKSSLQEVSKRSDKISEPNDFLTSESGVILLDSICMKLSAVGESIKNLDKITNHELLPKYSEIPWKNVMGYVILLFTIILKWMRMSYLIFVKMMSQSLFLSLLK